MTCEMNIALEVRSHDRLSLVHQSSHNLQLSFTNGEVHTTWKNDYLKNFFNQNPISFHTYNGL